MEAAWLQPHLGSPLKRWRWLMWQRGGGQSLPLSSLLLLALVFLSMAGPQVASSVSSIQSLPLLLSRPAASNETKFTSDQQSSRGCNPHSGPVCSSNGRRFADECEAMAATKGRLTVGPCTAKRNYSAGRNSISRTIRTIITHVYRSSTNATSRTKIVSGSGSSSSSSSSSDNMSSRSSSSMNDGSDGSMDADSIISSIGSSVEESSPDASTAATAASLLKSLVSPVKCSSTCLRPNPVCGENGVTFWCGVQEAQCAGAEVAYVGACAPESGVPGLSPRTWEGLVLAHQLWILVAAATVLAGLL
ncbi:hypothetical protein CLOM_g13315 [Closterium sp. NIES-68]|nr:hypothetical protein CLOM_g13315 [Closterium sp. NIES-68]GJP71401.1 hypothetical protein CLOP_g2235 [Closterium sp. NIES-67]